MQKIFEKQIKAEIIKILKEEKQREMNQFKFDDGFLEKIEKIFESNKTDKDSNVLEEQKTEPKEEINLMDYNKIFRS